jgi:hypothetical protein
MKPQRIIEIVWLPALLIVFLVLETFLFNTWLSIDVGQFGGRCFLA